jgi:protein-S-isoprenylcysteine O-methyltransferase Ste14
LFARFAGHPLGKVWGMTTKRTLMGAGDRMMALMLPFLLAAIVTWALGVNATLVTLPRAAMIVGAILTGFGVLGYLWSAVDIVRSFRVKQLVTTGAFGLCRHPLYAAWIVGLLPGLALISGNVLFVLAEVALIVGYLLFIGREEQQLLAEFGDAYRSYARRRFGVLPLGPVRSRCSAPTPGIAGSRAPL